MNIDCERVADLAKARALECGVDLDAFDRAVGGRVAITDRSGEIPDEVWTDVGAAALNSLWLPGAIADRPTLGSALARAAVAEHTGFADPGFAIAMPGPGLSMPPLLALGEAEQQRFHLGRFVSAVPRWGAFAITEPGSGSDATALRTSARKTSGGYVLNGEKCFITNGARADFTIVFATLDRSRGRFGIRAFLVDRDSPGFVVDRVEQMLGLRGSQLTAMSFQDCFVPEENLLWSKQSARRFDAFAAAQDSWDFMRPVLSSIIVGFCRKVRSLLGAHLAEFGPAGRSGWRQAEVEGLLIEIERKIAAARLLAWRAAAKYDAGQPMSMEASIAKAFASRVAYEIVDTAISVAGPSAFRPGALLEKARRDAKAFDILEGTGDMQRLMVTNIYHRTKMK